MSEMVYKTVLRFPLPYRGWSEREVLDDLKESVEQLSKGSDALYWYEDDEDFEECSSWYLDDNLIRLIRYENKRYVLDYIIGEARDDYLDELVSLSEINNIANSLCEVFNVDKESVLLHTYGWYTGVDEPIPKDIPGNSWYKRRELQWDREITLKDGELHLEKNN